MGGGVIPSRRGGLRWRVLDSVKYGVRIESRFWKFRRLVPTHFHWSWVESGDYLLTDIGGRRNKSVKSVIKTKSARNEGKS